MNLSRILQSLLFRDVLSYGVPGAVTIMGPLLILEDARSKAAGLLESVEAAVGNTLTILLGMAFVYACGYGASLVGWVGVGLWTMTSRMVAPHKTCEGALWHNLHQWLFLPPFELDAPAKENLSRCCGGLDDLRLERIDHEIACLAALQATDPDWFDMNIERQWTISNLEMGLVGAGCAWLAAIGRSPLALWWHYAAVAMIVIVILRSYQSTLHYVRQMALMSYCAIIKGGVQRIGTKQ